MKFALIFISLSLLPLLGGCVTQIEKSNCINTGTLSELQQYKYSCKNPDAMNNNGFCISNLDYNFLTKGWIVDAKDVNE